MEVRAASFPFGCVAVFFAVSISYLFIFPPERNINQEEIQGYQWNPGLAHTGKNI